MKPTGSEHVVFVAFQPEDAYLIDIYAHESDGTNWAERGVLETLVRNWDGAGILFPAQDGTSLRAEFDDDGRLELERADVHLMVEIDGRVWSSAPGSSSGAPRVAVKIGRWSDSTPRPRSHVAQRPAMPLQLDAACRGSSPPPSQGQYGYYGENANRFMPFGTLDPP
jgi:hypothetical protein